MKYFQPQEFPEDLKFADPELLLRMDELRGFIKIPIHPSPVPGALARFDAGASDSEHYAVNRKSRAVDFFCEADPFEAFTKILHSGLFHRVGVYFDTYYKNRKWVMFHVDLKETPLIWFRHDKKYSYDGGPLFHHSLFKQLFLNKED